MRLYLSSFGLGDHSAELLRLLRGGKRVAVILNAKDGSSVDSRARSLAQEMNTLVALDLAPVEVDLRKYFGDPEGLRTTLAPFDLVWIRGGNTFVLRRALRQSGGDQILLELLAKDTLVYGGFSAAMAVLTPSLRGVELVDDPTTVPVGYAGDIVWEGLDLLPYAVAPHYRSDHPESESVERLVEHFIDHHVPFRALRDGQVIVVDGDRHIVLP